MGAAHTYILSAEGNRLCASVHCCGVGFTVTSFNVNGIRAARRRGFDDWLADLRRRTTQFLKSDDVGSIPGRNGVALLTRHEPAAVRSWAAVPPKARGLGAYSDHGRYIEVDLADRPLTVACLYLPKGGLPAHLQRPGGMRAEMDGGAKYKRKMAFLAGFARELDRNRLAAARAGRDFTLIGDLNVAHVEHDVTNWRAARKMEGFLPEEREWFSSLLSPRRLVDVVRQTHGDQPGPLTWWSWAGESFSKDVGWRVDHQLASPALARRAEAVWVDKEPSPDARLSDHAPLSVRYRD